MYSFLIVDDHPVISVGAEALIKSRYFTAKVIRVENGNDALNQLHSEKFDLVLLDILLPDTDTQALLHNIKMLEMPPKILVYSSAAENVFAKQYMSMGANGFLSKSSSKSEFLIAIETVLSNRNYLQQSFIELLANDLRKGTTSINPFLTLTQRETEVLHHLLSGQSRKKISAIMSLEPSTIGTQKFRIFKKIGVNNMLDLMRLAIQYGFYSN